MKIEGGKADVYRLIKKVNGKSYIGSNVNLEKNNERLFFKYLLRT